MGRSLVRSESHRERPGPCPPETPTSAAPRMGLWRRRPQRTPSHNGSLSLATHSARPYCLHELASVYLSLLRKCGLVIANGIGSAICLGTASVLAGLMYGEVSTARVFMLLLLILLFLAAGFYLFIRCLKVISPRRRIGGYPWHVHHDEPK